MIVTTVEERDLYWKVSHCPDSAFLYNVSVNFVASREGLLELYETLGKFLDLEPSE